MYKAYRSTIERKNLIRWHKIVRLEGAGLPIDHISKLSGFTYDQVRRTLESPYYQEWRNARLSNRVSTIDAALSEDAEQMKAALRELVPAAIHRIEAALNSQDESIALRAASEILDRDERFNKTHQVAVTHLIPQQELDRARTLARELRKQTLNLVVIKQAESTTAIALSDRETISKPS